MIGIRAAVRTRFRQPPLRIPPGTARQLSTARASPSVEDAQSKLNAERFLAPRPWPVVVVVIRVRLSISSSRQSTRGEKDLRQGRGALPEPPRNVVVRVRKVHQLAKCTHLGRGLFFLFFFSFAFKEDLTNREFDPVEEKLNGRAYKVDLTNYM